MKEKKEEKTGRNKERLSISNIAFDEVVANLLQVPPLPKSRKAKGKKRLDNYTRAKLKG